MIAEVEKRTASDDVSEQKWIGHVEGETTAAATLAKPTICQATVAVRLDDGNDEEDEVMDRCLRARAPSSAVVGRP